MKKSSSHLSIFFSIFFSINAYSSVNDPGWALATAITKGNETIVEEIFARGVQDPNGYALAAAVYKEKHNLIDRFLDQEVKPPFGRAIEAAIDKGKYDIVEKFLLNSGEEQGNCYRDALRSAIFKGKYGIVDELLTRYEGVHIPSDDALQITIYKKNNALLERLLKLGAKDSKGTILADAIQKEEYDVADKLINLGGAQDPYKWALRAAIKNGNENLINALLTPDSYKYALLVAIEKENYVLVNQILSSGVQDSYGHALEAAIKIGNEILVDTLLAHGAMDPEGRALAAAINIGNEAIVNKLLSSGAQDPYGWALKVAVLKGNDVLVEKILLIRETLLLPMEILKRTLLFCGDAYYFATNILKIRRREVHFPEKNLLLTLLRTAEIGTGNNGDFINENNHDKFALARAIYENKDATVEILLRSGAQDSDGVALAAALYQGKYNIAEMLLKQGVRDPYKLALRAAFKTGNLIFAVKIVAYYEIY